MSANDKFDPYQGRTRIEYLRDLAEEYEVDEDAVFLLADLLGPSEDFDGLVTSVQDMEGGDFY